MNKEEFKIELQKLNIALSSYQEEQLEQYYHLLITENKKYNLTSITDKEDVYLKHFYDCLTMTKIIDLKKSLSLCDIGTGAGFPGVVLKIFFPNLDITLVEATQKKCKFLSMIITKLNLQQITVVNERAEIYSKINKEKFDIVTSRAVAPLKHLLEYSIPLLKVKGYYIAMKSDIKNEMVNIPNYEQKLSISRIDEITFQLPKENSLRTLLKYQKTLPTNPRYPRKYSEIKKKDI